MTVRTFVCTECREETPIDRLLGGVCKDCRLAAVNAAGEGRL